MRGSRPGSIRALTLAQIAALTIYEWRASDLALSDGAAVSSWTGVHGTAATQATGSKQPIYRATGLNGHPAVAFSSANVSALATGTLAAMANPYTVIVVGKAPTTTPSAIQYLTGGNSAGSRRDVYYNTNRTFGLQGSAGNNGSVTAPADTPFIVIGIFDPASSQIRHDGIPLAGSSGNTGSSSPVGIVLGARNGSTSSFDGSIAHVAYIAGRPTDAVLAAIERGLSAIYGIPLSEGGVAYVDPTTGSDTANTGRSPLSPVATATKGHSLLGTSPGRIEIAAGTLRELLSITTTGPRLIKLNGTTWYGSERHTSGWASVGGGVYSKAVTGYSTSVTHARVVTDLDGDGFWTTLNQNLSTPTTPAAGEIGFSASTLYVHLAGGADPNTKTIEVPKFDACVFSRTTDEHVVRGFSGAKVMAANRANILVGAAGLDGRMVTIDVDSEYGGDLGCFATQNDAVSFKRYRCTSRRAMNDGGNWHTTRTDWSTTVYSEDCDDAYNYDEGESSHDYVTHVVRGGRKHHNVGGGGITNVAFSRLDADGSAAGALEVDHNHTASLNTKEGGISIYEATTTGVIGPNVHSHDNNGPNYYFELGATGSVDPAAKAASTGGANPDVYP